VIEIRKLSAYLKTPESPEVALIIAIRVDGMTHASQIDKQK
jgi:hypothetical protein